MSPGAFIGVAVLIAVGGCLETNTVRCADGRTCPAGKSCDDMHSLCVDPDQLLTCGALVDDAACTLDAAALPMTGECDQGVCLEQHCGDRAITHLETCDGSPPAVGTCVDYQYDYGHLGCSSLCTEGTDACGLVGWRFKPFVGIGMNGSMWQDGDVLWIASQRGVGRCVGPTCTYEPLNMRWQVGVWASGGEAFLVSHEGYARRFDGTAWSEQQIATVDPDTGTVVQRRALDAVWGRSPAEVYAVGRLGKIFRFDGSTWTEMTTPTVAHLRAVWGNATTVFAAGDGGTLLRLDASNWVAVASGQPQADFYGMWGSAANDVVLVGFDAGDNAGFLGHYNGVAVTKHALPDGASPEVLAVSGRAANEVYAATGAGDVLFFDGAGWSRMIKPPTGRLASVFAGPSAVYAGGLSDLVIEYKTAGWVETPTQPGGGVAMWGSDLRNVFAISGSKIYEHDGTVWSAVDYPLCMSTAITFWLDMFGTSANDVYAAGPYGALMHRGAGGQWTCPVLPPSVLPSDKPMWMQAIWASAPNDVYAVGGSGDGTVLYAIHYNGASWEDWSDRLRPLMHYAFVVWGSSANDVYVAGSDALGAGKLAHYDGTVWSAVDTGIDVPFRAMWGSGPSDVYLVGSKGLGTGAIIHFDGTQWSHVVIPEGLTLSTTNGYEDVHGTAPNDVYIIGQRSLLRFDGMGWYPIRRPDVDTLTRLQVIGGEVFLASASRIGTRLVGTLQQPSP